VANVWIWNINRQDQKFFADELRAGRLRQGWGYDPRLDLRQIQARIRQGETLDEDETATWSRLSPMVDGVKPEDTVLVKNTPEFCFYTIVKVIGEYCFDNESELDDYRHYIPVNVLVEINRDNILIPGDLSNSVNRSQSPVNLSLRRAAEITEVLIGAQSQTVEQRRTAATFSDKIGKHSAKIIEAVERTIKELSPKEFEKLILTLFETMDFENPVWTAGPGENGADIVMSIAIPFFDEQKIVVQVKHHHNYGADNDLEPVNQLRRAFQYYNAIAGILVDSAQKLGSDLSAEIEKLRSEGKQIAVLYGHDLYRRILQILPATGASD
jgi:Restriction endonuclease